MNAARLALGTVQFGLAYGVANREGQVSEEAGRRMLALAAGGGIDTLDTAIAYGDSEARLGAIGTAGFKVVSKLPPLPPDVSDVDAWVQGQVRESLARLKVDRLYGLLLHRPLEVLGPRGPELRRALLSLRADGLAERLGGSFYGPEEIAEVWPTWRFDLMQAPLNLLDRRLATRGWLARLKDSGVEIHTRSAFLQGLLLMPRAEMPPRFARWAPLLASWQDWLAARGVSALRACLGYPLSCAEINRVVVGADSPAQLRQILDEAAGPPCYPADIASDDEDLINPARWPAL